MSSICKNFCKKTPPSLPFSESKGTYWQKWKVIKESPNFDRNVKIFAIFLLVVAVASSIPGLYGIIGNFSAAPLWMQQITTLPVAIAVTAVGCFSGALLVFTVAIIYFVPIPSKTEPAAKIEEKSAEPTEPEKPVIPPKDYFEFTTHLQLKDIYTLKENQYCYVYTTLFKEWKVAYRNPLALNVLDDKVLPPTLIAHPNKEGCINYAKENLSGYTFIHP